MPVLVVLVHGTFARGATWTRPSASPLCARLRRAFGTALEFDAFEWSGENSHAARVDGGVALAAHLQDLVDHRRGRALFVIGHSHGGTVITHALRHRPVLVRELDGVVFLSTPFLQVRRRPHASALAWFFGLSLWVAVISLAVEAENQLRALGTPGWLAGLLGFSIMALLMIALIAGIYESRQAGNGKGAKKDQQVARLDLAIDRLRAEFSVPPLASNRTLILRANADEASAALAWVQAISRLLSDLVALLLRWLNALMPWTAVKLLDKERRSTGPLSRITSALGLLVLCYLIVVLVIGMLAWLADAIVWLAVLFGLDLPGAITGYLPATSTLGEIYWAARGWVDGVLGDALKALMLFVAAVLAFVTVVLVTFNRAFGRWFIWTALFVEVSVEPVPPGRWAVRQVEPLDQTEAWFTDKGAALTHSLSYEDPRALRIIASWMRCRVRAHYRTGAGGSLFGT